MIVRTLILSFLLTLGCDFVDYVEEIEHFALVCPDGDECKGGTVCDPQTKICVYPYP